MTTRIERADEHVDEAIRAGGMAEDRELRLALIQATIAAAEATVTLAEQQLRTARAADYANVLASAKLTQQEADNVIAVLANRPIA